MNKWEYTCDGIGNSVYGVTIATENADRISTKAGVVRGGGGGLSDLEVAAES